MSIDRLIKGKIPGEETGIEVKKSICAICNPMTHCGLDLYVKDGKIIKVEGSLEHPSNKGTLCSKGSATRQYVYNSDRIKTPLKRIGEKGSGEFEEISWEEAYKTISEKLNKLKKEEGPEAAAFFVGYTKWLRPFAQRLAFSFGTPNYSTESSTCFKATAMAWKLNYGGLASPDIKNTNCLLVWSCNPVYTSTTLSDMLLNKIESGMKLIVVDPRITPTAAKADIHLRLKPGTDGALALGIANVIISEKLYDEEFINKSSFGFEEYKNYVKEFTVQKTSEITGVPEEKIIQAARLYANTNPAALMHSAAPVVHNTNGVQNYRAVMLLVGLTGNFDVKGGNVVRNNTYLETPAGFDTRVDEYIRPRKRSEMKSRLGEGIVPVWCEMTDEGQAIFLPKQILSEKPYPIKQLIAFGMNSRMWPDTENVLNAIKKLEFFVNTDIFLTETCKYADIVLPVCTSVERSEFKCYGSGHVIYTQPAIDPLFDSKSDADIIFDLAKYLDVDDDLMKQGYEKNLDWILEPAGLSVEELKKYPGGITAPNLKPFVYQKYLEEGFHTPSGKIEFTSSVLSKYREDFGYESLPVYKSPKSSKESMPDLAEEYPFIINSGSRLPMFIHSRTFRLPWTKSLRPENSADINPQDAKNLDIKQGDEIKISTPKGEIRIKANISPIVLQGVVCIYHNYESANVNLLIDADYVDPISGFAGFKAFLGKIEKVG